MLAFHADAFVLPLPPGHSFPMTKYRLLRDAVEQTLSAVRVTEAPPATDGEPDNAAQFAELDLAKTLKLTNDANGLAGRNLYAFPGRPEVTHSCSPVVVRGNADNLNM